MEYYIKELNRTVELDDNLVKKYEELEGPLRDAPFVLSTYFTYGYEPSEDEISNEKFSIFCNEVLCGEIETSLALPEVTDFIINNKDKIHKATKNGEFIDLNIEEMEKD